MTDDSMRDDALRDAFQARTADSGTSISDEDRERVWQAVSGELDAPARRALVERMATEPALAEAWRLAVELWHAANTGAVAPVKAATRPRWRIWQLAAAAAVVVAAVGTVSVLRDRSGGDVVREQPSVTIESLVSEAPMPRDAFQLRWTPAPAGSRYDVRVTTEDLRLVTSAAEIATAELTIDPDQLAGLAAGSRLLWQVDAILPGGARVSSATFVATLQ